MPLLKLKPSVPKFWLFLIAGLLWSHVGIMLCKLSYQWLMTKNLNDAVPFILSGITLAIIAYRFLFSKIVKKNINRIDSFPGKSCIFAFQPWRSYFLIIFMVALGINLRKSSFPKVYLAIIYLAIGGALFLSSIHYYIYLWKTGEAK